LRPMGRLDHHPQGHDAHSLQAHHHRQRRLPVQSRRFCRRLADLAQPALLPGGGATALVRRADPAVHRAPPHPRHLRLRHHPDRRLRAVALSLRVQMVSRRFASSLALLGSIAVIAGAWLFQMAGGLAPCELCLLERWPYYIAIPLLLLAFATGLRRGFAALLITLVLMFYLAGSVLAFYHVGVELHWFAGPSACTGPTGAAHTVAALKAQLMGQ